LDEPLEQKLIAKIKVLHDTIWDSRASQPAVDEWLRNFSLGARIAQQKLHALYLLSNFMYFGARQMRALLKAMFRDLYKYPIIETIRKDNGDTTDIAFINARFMEKLKNTRFLGIGNPSESGSHLLYYYRQENRLPNTQFVHSHQIFRRKGKSLVLRQPEVDHFVFIDDFCGSGDQGLEYSKEILGDLKRLAPTAWAAYHVIFATSHALKTLRKKTRFDSVDSVYELDRSFRCFDQNSRYFTPSLNGLNKDFARKMCRAYGRRLRADCPLGYGNSQLLIGFHHNTPDNTLPIIWYDEPEGPAWKAIFRRYPKDYGWGQP
jgi:hypothetical protein